jgi:hypothetical protein
MKQSDTANYSDTVAQAHSHIVTIDLMHVSVPAENGSNIPIMGFSLKLPYNGLFTNIPLVGFSLTSSYM